MTSRWSPGSRGRCALQRGSPWIPRSVWNAWTRPTWWPCPPLLRDIPGCGARTTPSHCLPRCGARSHGAGECSASAPARSSSGRPGCWMDGGARRTGGTCPTWRSAARPRTSTLPCSTWTPTRSSPAPAPPPASTPVSTWSARNTGARWPTPSRGGWWCRHIATAGRHNTSTGRCPPHPPTPWPRSSAGWRATSTSRSPSASWPRAHTCRRARSPAGSSRKPGPPRTGGSPASASCSPSSCWKRPARRWMPSPSGPGSGTRPPCATTSAPGSTRHRTHTGARSAWRHHFRTWKHTTPHAYRRAFRLAGAA